MANYVYNLKEPVERFSQANIGSKEGIVWINSCLRENALVSQEF